LYNSSINFNFILKILGIQTKKEYPMINKSAKMFLLLTFFSLVEINAKEKPTVSKKQKLLLTPQQEAAKTDQNKGETPKKSEKEIYPWFGTVAEVVSLIEKKAFKNDVDFSSFFQEALKNAVPCVDAHSAFFSKDAYKSTMESTSGEFSGIGVSIISKAPQDDALVIVEVIQGGPGQKSGLKSGDKIMEVNGEKLRGLSTDEVINKLKGKVGTEAKLKILRDKKPLEFKIKRDLIKDQTSICYLFKKQNIYYLSLKLFTETAANQMSELLKKANEGACNGIVLDLRRNPGGILDSAVDMAALFLPKKSLIVSTKDKNHKPVAEYYTKTDPILKSDLPIFVIIDNFTASASEILAGCLKHYSEQNFSSESNNGKNKKLMVFLIGTPTFGKGSVQEVIPVSNGCALKLTTMLYYLPNQKSIQAIGIEPDFLIKPRVIPEEEIKWIKELYGKETSLKNYIPEEDAAEKGQKEQKNTIKKDGQKNSAENEEENEKSWEEKQLDALIHDNQVQASINMINTLNMAKKCYPNQVNSRQKAIDFIRQNYLTDDPTKIDLEKIK
jgi:carboxyl-terminal processing protease